MDPLAFLRERDPLLRAVQQAIAAAASELERKRDQSRANLHAFEIGKVLQSLFKK